jgi:hypothetical protein
MHPRSIVQALDPHGRGGLLDEPWIGWLAICLCRQRARQAWLCEVERNHLADRDDGEGDQGDVPDLPGWSYELHGSGLRLDGPGRESIDYDFHDRDGRAIDPYFFAGRVMRLDKPQLPEARLRRWLLVGAGIVQCLDRLRALGAIVDHESETARGHVFQLDGALADIAFEVAALDFGDEGLRADHARALGDVELVDAPEQARAALASAHAALLLGWARDRTIARRVLGPVTQVLPPAEAAEACLSLIAGPIDPTTGQALEAIAGVAVDATAEVLALLGRLSPTEHHPYPAWAAARYLLERGVAHDLAIAVVEAFAAVEVVPGFHGNPYDDKMAMLMLEHAPDRALPWVRRALRSSTPSAVEAMAALLAVLGFAWCHRELEAALREPAEEDDRKSRGARRYLAAALRYSDSELAQRRGDELSPKAAERAPGAIGFTFDEVLEASMARMFPAAMERAMPLAERLLARQPPLDL